MIDYQTVPIQGDISRLDVKVLIELCADKRVVEFGVGGSTLILARIAKTLKSYDTSQLWIDKTQIKLEKILSEIVSVPEFILTTGEEEDIEECDILFIDGNGEDRYKWLKFLPKCKVMICHDSLGDTGGYGPALYHIMSCLFKDMRLVEYLDKAYYHYMGSNMAVIYRREEPIKYENWNLTDKSNRLDPYID